MSQAIREGIRRECDRQAGPDQPQGDYFEGAGEPENQHFFKFLEGAGMQGNAFHS
jgi:hypothetical protein